jgi:hypothetical protein
LCRMMIVRPRKQIINTRNFDAMHFVKSFERTAWVNNRLRFRMKLNGLSALEASFEPIQRLLFVNPSNHTETLSRSFALLETEYPNGSYDASLTSEENLHDP